MSYNFFSFLLSEIDVVYVQPCLCRCLGDKLCYILSTLLWQNQVYCKLALAKKRARKNRGFTYKVTNLFNINIITAP
jgi:hypothetical protein